jgi:hypothetical protein
MWAFTVSEVRLRMRNANVAVLTLSSLSVASSWEAHMGVP